MDPAFTITAIIPNCRFGNDFSLLPITFRQLYSLSRKSLLLSDWLWSWRNPVMLVFIRKLSLIMSTLRWVPICQSFSHFSGFLHHFVLAKLVTSSIKVKFRQLYSLGRKSLLLSDWPWILRCKWIYFTLSWMHGISVTSDITMMIWIDG